MKKILLGLLVCAGFGACTSEDVVVSNVGTQNAAEGGVAYMTVRINDVGSSTRATDGGYQNGTATEYAVNDAYFYFYDEFGVYVSQAEVWDGGDAVSGNGNVEFKGNTVIILKGLTGVGYPRYVVTVLNRPSGFTPGETLTDMAALLSDPSGVGITTPRTVGTTDTDYFIITTSSYVDDTDATTGDTRPAYFVTTLEDSDFYEEPIPSDLATIEPVDIYVERLAAKVGTDVSSNLEGVELGNGETGYRLTETIAGDGNEQTSDNDAGDEVVYVVINGWALNGTAKHSNIVKDIDGTWTDTALGFTWNVPTDYRSYWGKSFNYGLGFGQYPTTSEGASNAAGSEKDGTTLNTWLDYVSYNDLTYGMGDSEYCAENTNTAGGAGDANAVIQTKNTSAITNALIAATVCDVQGNPLDLVRYQGALFTEVHFLDYVMTELKATSTTGDPWNVYTATTVGEGNDAVTTYTQINSTYITLGKTITSGGSTLTRYDGYIVVVANEDAFDENETYYYNTGTTDASGDPVMAAYTDVAAAIAAVNDVLYPFDVAHDAINAYTGGAMYYSVPIEHLNNTVGTVTDDNGNVIPLEANYGIVRNHWYNLTITSIENLGKGVFDPDEVIIPNIDDEKYYYVGAQINILSWKLVEQGVAL